VETSRDEPIGVVIHMCMKQHKESPCEASFSQTSKNAMFLLLSFMLFLLQNRRTGGWSRLCWSVGVSTSESGELVGKGVGD
jgi:hypothetical protein